MKINDPYITFKKKLVGAVPVYYNYLPTSPCIHISIGFKVGSLHDPKNKEGMAHFLEHCVLNGSPLLPTPKDVRIFEKKYTLDTLNAMTDYWDTEYVAKCLPEHLKETAEGMFDLVFNCFIDPKETEREKNIIIQEIWDRHRNQKYKKYLKENLKITRPGLDSERMVSAAGWDDTVKKITPNDLKMWQKAHYHRGNMHIVLVGAVSEEHINLISKIISKIPSGKLSFHNPPKKKVQKPLLNQKIYKSDNIGMKQDFASLTIQINTPKNIKNIEILTLATDLLYNALFEKLREEMGLCYRVHVYCHPYLDYISNFIEFNLPPQKIKEAERETFKVIDEIKKGKYKEKFEEEKRISIDFFRSKERTADLIIRATSNNLISYKKIRTLKEIIFQRKKVTYKQTADYISKTFKKENVYIEKILP